MKSDNGVISLPYRIAIAMIVTALAFPICMNCISEERYQLSRRAAIAISEKITETASELVHRPIGESRLLRIESNLAMLDSKVHILAGGVPDSSNSSLIRCVSDSGWMRIFEIELGREIHGLCSEEFLPLLIDCDTRDLKISRELRDHWDLLILEEI